MQETAEPEEEDLEMEELEEEPELPRMTNHLMIEARSPEKGHGDCHSDFEADSERDWSQESGGKDYRFQAE